jgi:hypothetical protein
VLFNFLITSVFLFRPQSVFSIPPLLNSRVPACRFLPGQDLLLPARAS